MPMKKWAVAVHVQCKSHQDEDNIKYEGGRRVDNLLPAAE